jgi:hypothetical protein
LDDYRFVTLHYSYAGVGGAQVNADDLSHEYKFLVCFLFEYKTIYSRLVPLVDLTGFMSVCQFEWGISSNLELELSFGQAIQFPFLADLLSELALLK